MSGPLRRHREASHAAWVFTSATLAVAGGFSHIATRLGIDAARELLQPSPFDWPRQALCYLPTRMPEPAARDYGAAVVEALWPVLEASGGRAFVLFASHRALREATELLRDAPWPLFVQGTEPAMCCCSVSASPATACCWAPPASARAWTWPATRCRWW